MIYFYYNNYKKNIFVYIYKMSLTKCQKYLHKLSNTDVNDEKFNLYLEKLNFWYGRGGGIIRI